MERIRIFIADDHPMFRDGLRLLINSVEEFEVVGEGASGQEVIEKAARLQPDVILMDIQMPGLDGIEATRQILTTSPHIGILILTMFDDDDSVLAAMRAGARGYLLKGARQDEILGAVRAVNRGEVILGAPIANKLMGYLTAPKSTGFSAVFPDLTAREVEILNLIASGDNNTEIAERLFLSPKTVRNHVSNIFHKLEVADRAQAIIRARTAGMGDDSK